MIRAALWLLPHEMSSSELRYLSLSDARDLLISRAWDASRDSREGERVLRNAAIHVEQVREMEFPGGAL